MFDTPLKIDILSAQFWVTTIAYFTGYDTIPNVYKQIPMNRDYALLDGALGRAREGIRVLEDCARFVLADTLFIQLKKIRHTLRLLDNSLGQAALLNARQGGEQAPPEALPTENNRSNLLSIIRANANRSTEALRALEEFSKIYSPGDSADITAARYSLYQIELTLARLTPHYWLDWYNLSGFIYPISDSVTDLIYYIKKGARVVQLRDKFATSSEYFLAAKNLTAFVTQFNNKRQDEKVLIILNDNVDVAARLPVAGVHLGQTDLPVASARRMLGSNKIIGRSNNNLLELKDSLLAGSDYVSFGPVFETPNKPEKSATGLPLLAQAVAASNVPLVAIGGVNPSKISHIYATGAKNLAVISAAPDFYK